MKKKFFTEVFLFYLVVAIHCLPVLFLSFFVTHDGPAHVYNSILIRDLLNRENPLASGFFSFRHFPEPNWIGHALMSLFDFVMPAPVAERLLLVIFIFSFPYVFRKLVLFVNPGAGWLTFLVFPFIYSYAFYGGLYNFLLGIPVFLFSVLFFLRKQGKYSRKDFVTLFLLSMLLYFSHLVIFGIFVAFVIIHFVIGLIRQSSIKEKKFSIDLVSLLPVIALIPGILLGLSFIIRKLSLSQPHRVIPFSTLIHDLFVVIPSIALSTKEESKYGIMTALVFIFLISTVLVDMTRNKMAKNGGPNRNLYGSTWLVCCLLMLLCFFVLPDDLATGGVVKVRFGYFFFLFLILWLSSRNISSRTQVIAASIVLLTVLVKLGHFTKISGRLSDDAVAYVSASEFITPNSIVLPLNYSDNWMHSNLSNYLGTEKHILVLDNYEAGREHFPLQWKPGMNPVLLMGSFNGDLPLCADIARFEKSTGKKIDYVIRWMDNVDRGDSCSVQIQQALRDHYRLTFKTLDKRMLMYKRKS